MPSAWWSATRWCRCSRPIAMRGRVSAVNSVFIVASNDLGGLESGLTAWLVGPVISVVGGGIAHDSRRVGLRPRLAADSRHRLAPGHSSGGGGGGGIRDWGLGIRKAPRLRRGGRQPSRLPLPPKPTGGARWERRREKRRSPPPIPAGRSRRAWGVEADVVARPPGPRDAVAGLFSNR